MAVQTITEALAEIKTIGKRIEKKREFVGQYLARQAIVRDPLVNEGGSTAAIAAEQQSVRDLEERIVALRLAISKANTDTLITVNGKERSIAGWLTWRREVAPKQKETLARLRGAVTNMRAQMQQKGMIVQTNAPTDPTDKDVVVHIDERALSTEGEQLENTLGMLDGLLSLKNATITVDV